jgi:hypothetical protein
MAKNLYDLPTYYCDIVDTSDTTREVQLVFAPSGGGGLE